MFNANDFIKHKQEILINNHTHSITLHFALGFDNNYAMPAGIAITSIIENNPDINLVFHLFLNNVSNDNLKKFSQFPSSSISIIGYHLNNKLNINPDTLLIDNVNESTCIRFIIPEVLKDTIQTVIYLDSDVLCLNSLKALSEYELDNYIACVVPDDAGMQNKIQQYYNIDHKKYFNAGFLLINIKKWCEENVSEKAFELINSGTIYKYADQDVLNILLENKTFLLPIKYNTKIHLSHSGIEEDKIAPYIAILHYVTGHKPWYKVYHSNLFNIYQPKSPWKYDKMPIADKNSSLRSYAKYLFSCSRYLSACKFIYLYVIGKILKQ